MNTIIMAQVAVNHDGDPPHSSAMLDVESSSKGVLIPRLTTAQRITLGGSAIGGLMVYDTDLNDFYYHDGTTWQVGSTGNLWTRNGSITYVSNTGDDVGIGTTSPGYMAGATQYLSVSTPGFGSNQIVALELKGASTTTYSPVGRIDFLSHGNTNTVYNTARIETRITGSQYEGELLFFTKSSTLAERMRIDEDGNVGIGTTSPGRIFEVAGDWKTARLSSTSAGAFLEFVGSHATDWAIGSWDGSMHISSSTDNFVNYTTHCFFNTSYFSPMNNNDIYLGSNSNRWKNIYSIDGDFSGDVGIGTTTPARSLEVVGGWRTARLRSSASGAFLEFVGTSSPDWAVGTYAGTGRILSSSDNFASSTDEFIFSPTYFAPFTGNSKDLGRSSGRWRDVYSIDGNYSGTIDMNGDAEISTRVGGLHLHDDDDSHAFVYITPATSGSGDSASIFLAEDDEAYYGMYWMYDGSGNQMELWGKSATTYYGPHIVVNRADGDIAFGGTFATGYEYSFDGDVICEKVRVMSSGSWPDYVFSNDYPLLPVSQLGKYINEHGHLPNIPSAREIEEEGIDLGEMQKLMMEKIEELTLYILLQQKEINELKEQVKTLSNE